MPFNFNIYSLPELNIIEPLSFGEQKERLVNIRKETDPDFIAYESSREMLELEAFAYALNYQDAKFNQQFRNMLPLYAKGENLDDSCMNFYGTTRLEGENDEAFLERSLLSLQQSSTAGAEWSYIYHVKSVDSRIVDVLPWRPEAGEVNVTWFANEKDATELDLLEIKIIDKLTDIKIKPMGDQTHYVGDEVLRINRAIEVEFSLNATLRLKLGVDGDAVRAEALKRLNEFILTLKIGQDVKLSKLIALLDGDGVDEVIVTEPAANVAIDKNSIATLFEYEIFLEGLVDE